MNIAKNALMEAISRVMPGVEKGSSLIDGADTIVIAGSAVHSYNDHISVSHPAPALEGLSGSVKGVDFFKLVSKLPVESLDIDQLDNAWGIKTATGEAQVSLIQSNVQGYLQQLKLSEIQWQELPGEFIDALKLCRMSGNASTIRGLCVSGQGVYSSDTIRVNRYKLASAMEAFWIDDGAVSELAKLGTIAKYGISPAWVHFQTADGTIFSAKRKDHGAYPLGTIEGIVEAATTGETMATVATGRIPQGLDSVIDRVSIFGTDVQGTTAIRLTLGATTLTISSERVSGKMRESLPWEAPLAISSPIDIWVDSGFLLEASKKAMEFVLKDRAGRLVLCFQSGSYVQVVNSIAVPNA